MKFWPTILILGVVLLLTGLPVSKTTAAGALPSGVVAGTVIANHFCSDPNQNPSHFCVSTVCSPTQVDLDAIGNASILNAQYIRFDVWWNAIEPTADQFSPCAISYYRQILSDMQGQGLKAIAILGTSEPSWITSGCGCELSAAESYAGWIAENLGQYITYYQLGNELNWVGHPTGGSSPSQYIAALAQGVQAGQPSGYPYKTIVNAYTDVGISGGCSSTGSWYSSLQSWLGSVGNYIDVIAIDHYPNYFCPGTSWATDGFLSSLMGLAASYGKGYGVTETGFPAYCAQYICTPSIEQQQDTVASQTLYWVYNFANEETNSGNPLLFFGWYQLTDKNACTSTSNLSSPWECLFGLQRADTSNRPAFSTVQTYFHELIGYPVMFTESGIISQAPATWCVTFNGQSQCSSGQSITFNAQPGLYTYSVENPSCGTGCQYVPTPPSGTLNMGFSDAGVDLAFMLQYQITASATIIGGGSGYSPPTLTYQSEGQTLTSTLTSAGLQTYADAGSAWSINDQLQGSTQTERWQTNQQTNGVVSSSLNLDVTYYHQVLVTLSYSVNDGSTPPPPTLTDTQFGTTSSNLQQTTPTALWLDVGSSYSVANPLGTNQQERWYTSSPLAQGTVSGPTTISLTYFHQFALTMSYSIVGGGNPPPPTLSGISAGAPLNESLTEQPSTYWLDANSQFRIPSQIGSTSTERWVTGQQTNEIASSGSSQVASYQHEYYIQFAVQPPGDGSVSQQAGWFNAESELPVSATPGAGYVFKSWSSSNPSISFSSSSSPVTDVTVDGPGVVTASLILIPSTTTTPPSTSSTTVLTASSMLNSATNSSPTSTTSGSGIPEFPIQGVSALTLTVLIVGAYLIIRRHSNSKRAYDTLG